MICFYFPSPYFIRFSYWCSQFVVSHQKLLKIEIKSGNLVSLVHWLRVDKNSQELNRIRATRKKATYISGENMPVSVSSSSSSKANQNHKKKVQILMKKTHFTEIEVNRLLDIHYQIMVGFNQNNMLALDCYNISQFMKGSILKS